MALPGLLPLTLSSRSIMLSTVFSVSGSNGTDMTPLKLDPYRLIYESDQKRQALGPGKSSHLSQAICQRLQESAFFASKITENQSMGLNRLPLSTLEFKVLNSSKNKITSEWNAFSGTKYPEIMAVLCSIMYTC